MSGYDVQRDSLLNQIYGINATDFVAVALNVWQYQFHNNVLYKQFCQALGKNEVKAISDIPFLPIGMFRDHVVKSGQWEPQAIFASSGTTATVNSKHHIRDLNHYHRIAELCFASLYGQASDYTWIGLLPSYLERPDSSLIHMVHHFMEQNHRIHNGFFAVPDEQVINVLHQLAAENEKTILIGVSFALLDLFEKYKVPVWPNLLVLETGGMKGRRQELTREELHKRIRAHHGSLWIESEYGMTELLSQAYSRNHLFYPGPSMRICIRDISDPFLLIGPFQRGGINIIDLGNIDTCAFIATDDVGILMEDHSFEVLGRLDQSDLRGCNLMYH